jgi:hypothetical protein
VTEFVKSDEFRDHVEEAIKDAFTKLGLDVSNPLEAQRDFQHLRDWRLSMRSIKQKGILTIVGIAVTGAVAYWWVGLVSVVKGGP